MNPFCQSFQPPIESGIPASVNPSASNDTVFPPYSNQTVYECKWELDSLAAFLEVSSNYYNATGDLSFFQKYQWVDVVKSILNTTQAMMISTYGPDGSVNTDPYTFTRLTTTATDTQDNSGRGNPVRNGTGIIRSAFRPSDDSTIYQLFIPANMMFSRYLASASLIMRALSQIALADQISTFASQLRSAIETYGIVSNPAFFHNNTPIYAYEIDGYGSRNIMDDANIPSLLAAPFFGYLDANDTVYQATRRVLLSGEGNPYFMQGPVINSIGGPHDGPGFAWPMASIVRIFTSDDDTEITTALKEIVSSTDGLGKEWL